MCEKEKMLVTSIFSFTHNIFTMLFPQGGQKSSLWDAGLNTTPLIHSLIRYFETVSNSRKLQMTTGMWLLKDFNRDYIETIVEKGETAHLEQFHLFSTMFSKSSLLECVWISIYRGRSLFGYA